MPAWALVTLLRRHVDRIATAAGARQSDPVHRLQIAAAVLRKIDERLCRAIGDGRVPASRRAEFFSGTWPSEQHVTRMAREVAA